MKTGKNREIRGGLENIYSGRIQIKSESAQGRLLLIILLPGIYYCRVAYMYGRDARFAAGLERSFSSFGETSLVVLTHRWRGGCLSLIHI